MSPRVDFVGEKCQTKPNKSSDKTSHTPLGGLIYLTILSAGFDKSIPSPEAQLFTLWDGSVSERLEPLESRP